MKLSIWVTKTCNMACSYCYEEGLIREDTVFAKLIISKKQ